MKKILIVCYSFPPNEGIGGRRWAKFAKYLNRNGHDLRIITFDDHKKNSKRSAWQHDTVDLEKKTVVLPSHYPKWLMAYPNSFFGKVMYRLSLKYVKWMAKGNYYDRASLLGHSFQDEVRKNILLGYNNVIVTCAPFRLSHLVSELKGKDLDFNLIVDFRDPWTDNRTSYGFDGIGKERLEFEERIEKEVLEKVSCVFVVAEKMRANYLQRFSINPQKIKVIPNGFDKEDIPDAPGKNLVAKKNDLKKVVFVGTFYIKARKYFERLVNILKNNRQLGEHFSFKFIGDSPSDFPMLAKGIEQSIRVTKNLPLNQAMNEISQAHFASVFLTDDINYSFSTKFLESLYQRKPILVFSKQGFVTDFVVSNNLGFSVGFETMEEDLLKIAELCDSEKWEYNQAFDLSPFDIREITKLIEENLFPSNVALNPK